MTLTSAHHCSPRRAVAGAVTVKVSVTPPDGSAVKPGVPAPAPAQPPDGETHWASPRVSPPGGWAGGEGGGGGGGGGAGGGGGGPPTLARAASGKGWPAPSAIRAATK